MHHTSNDSGRWSLDDWRALARPATAASRQTVPPRPPKSKVKPFRPAGGPTPPTIHPIPPQRRVRPNSASQSRRMSLGTNIQPNGRREERMHGPPDLLRLERQTEEYFKMVSEMQQQTLNVQPQLKPPIPQLQLQQLEWENQWTQGGLSQSQHVPHQNYIHPTPPPAAPCIPVHSLGSSYSTVPLGVGDAHHTAASSLRASRPASAPPVRVDQQQSATTVTGLSSRPSAAQLMNQQQHRSHALMQQQLSQSRSQYDEKEETIPSSIIPTSRVEPVSRHESVYSTLLRQTPTAPSTAQRRADDAWSTAYMSRLTAKHDMGLSEAVFFAKSSAALSAQNTRPGMYTTASRLTRRNGWWQPEPPVNSLQSAPPVPTDYDSAHGSIAWINPTPLPQTLKEQAESKDQRREFKPSASFFGTGVERMQPSTYPQLQPAQTHQLLLSPSRVDAPTLGGGVHVGTELETRPI